MAVPTPEMADDCSSSSSDAEELKRCQEAAWDCQTMKTKDTGGNEKSKRFVVAHHEHDGNELQVTPGFQTHVAKKLGAMLDCLISENQSYISPCQSTETTDKKDEDEGFRLFSTSVPGMKPEEPSRPKRQPIPSSSDSDDEMELRLKEAAVSISDLLPPSAAVLSTSSTAPEMSNTETKEKVKKKKKKKRKRDAEKNGQQDSLQVNESQNVINQDKDQTIKQKKKKKKATSRSSEVLS